MVITDCPSRGHWLDFLLGKKPRDLSDAMVRHLQNCPKCQTIVQSTDDSTDSLLKDLRHDAPEDTYTREPQCRIALRHCERIADLLQVNSTCQRVADTGRGADQRQGDPMPTGQIGRYRLGEELGCGHFGRVYRTLGPSGEQLAIKVLHREIRNEAEAASFRTKGQRLLSLRHANLVKVHEVNVDGGIPYTVSELIEGTTLERLLQIRGALSCSEAARTAAAVADALGHAHAHDLVHRDVKPANILLDSRGNSHLTDFDLVATEEELEKEFRRISGTLAYMSPEQIGGLTSWLDGRSDTFSLGVVFYEMLRGKRPFRAKSSVELQDEICNRDPRPPRMTNPGIPEELERICLKCLAKRPENRYATAQDVANDLNLWLDRKRVVKRRLVLICLAVLLLGIPTVYWLSSLFSPPQKATVPSRVTVTDIELPTKATVTDITLIVRRDEDDTRIYPRTLLAQGVEQDVQALEPLQPNDDFRLEVDFSRPIYWYLVWFDTAGIASVAAHSPRKADTMIYPADTKPGKSNYMPVNPSDPEGKHWLALIVGDRPARGGIAMLEEQLAGLAHLANRVVAEAFEERGAGSPRSSKAVLPTSFLNKISEKLPDDLRVVRLIPLQTAK